MKVINGGFGKKKDEDAFVPLTVNDVLVQSGLSEKVPETFVLIMESDGVSYTVTNPPMTVNEIVGALEIHKTNMIMMAGIGEVH